MYSFNTGVVLFYTSTSLQWKKMLAIKYKKGSVSILHWDHRHFDGWAEVEEQIKLQVILKSRRRDWATCLTAFECGPKVNPQVKTFSSDEGQESD